LTDLFSESRVARIDSRGVHAVYDDWPKLARDGFRVKVELSRAPVNKLYVLGMGGSASGGDIVSGWLTNRPGVEMAVFKGHVPVGELSDAIAIACSASGETEETIRMLRTAVERKAQAISISAGGQLKDVSEELGVPHIEMPKFLAPRYHLPYILFSTLAVANMGLGLHCEEEAEDAFSEMEAEREEVRLATPLPRNGAKALAVAILERVPAVYGTRVTSGVGVRFKDALNENSKKHALFDEIPETFHNEIEGWEDPSVEFIPIFLRHSAESERDGAREDEMIRILDGFGKGPIQVHGRGKSSLAQLATMVYRLDLTSYYVAIALGRDPFPIEFIERLKKGR
jgi:glucose/mannose-6-phosphate isomerase